MIWIAFIKENLLSIQYKHFKKTTLKLACVAGSSFFGEGGGGKSLQTYQQYFIFRGREMPRNAIGRNCDICQILDKLHYVIFSRK